MTLDDLDRRILDRVQSGFPIASRPFQVLAEQVGSSEDEVLARVRRLQEEKIIRQIGPVFELKRLDHVSTLCAAKVRPDAVEDAAAFINKYREVTHNYLRENAFNVWFTVIASSPERIESILDEIRHIPGVESVVSLPAEKTYKIKVQFALGGEEP
jgi:DNA-binding Lrp family transcriptional regulator